MLLFHSLSPCALHVSSPWYCPYESRNSSLSTFLRTVHGMLMKESRHHGRPSSPPALSHVSVTIASVLGQLLDDRSS